MRVRNASCGCDCCSDVMDCSSIRLEEYVEDCQRNLVVFKELYMVETETEKMGCAFVSVPV